MKRLLLSLLPFTAFASAPVANWAPNLTTTVAWQGNASNGEAVWDRVGALQLGFDAIATSGHDFSPSDAFHLTGHLGGDVFPRFTGLDRGAVGGRIDWQHTFGRDALAPVFTVEGSGDAVLAGDSARRGMASAVTLRLSKRFGDVWRASVTQRFDQFQANHAVFDSTSGETGFEVGRDLNDSTRITLGGRWRDGDVVTYAQFRRPDLVGIARDFEASNTFHEAMTVYASKARTLTGRVALVHAVTDVSAVALAYEYGQTRRTDLKFANWSISLNIVRQF